MVESIGESKVGDDDVSVLVEEQIFQLEISVDNVFFVQIVDARDQLGEKFGGVSFL